VTQEGRGKNARKGGQYKSERQKERRKSREKNGSEDPPLQKKEKEGGRTKVPPLHNNSSETRVRNTRAVADRSKRARYIVPLRVREENRDRWMTNILVTGV